jgi:hypothetical protein
VGASCKIFNSSPVMTSESSSEFGPVISNITRGVVFVHTRSVTGCHLQKTWYRYFGAIANFVYPRSPSQNHLSHWVVILLQDYPRIQPAAEGAFDSMY